MDRIYIDRLSCECIIGTNDEERINKQRVYVSICLFTDIKAAADVDNLALAVNYYEVAERVLVFVGESRFFLIETLAEKIADICLGFEGVKKAEVTLEKPQALKNAQNIRIRIMR